MTSASSNLPYPKQWCCAVYQKFYQKYTRATEITIQLSHGTVIDVTEWIGTNDHRWRLFKNCAKIIDSSLIIEPKLVYEDNETLVKYFRAIFTAYEIANCPSSRAAGLTIEDYARNILEQKSRRGAWR